MTQYTEEPIRHARNPRRSPRAIDRLVIISGIVVWVAITLYFYAGLVRFSESLAH